MHSVKYFLTGALIAGFFLNTHAQVSLPDRNPFKLTLRGGVVTNDADAAAHLKSEIEKHPDFDINLKYAPVAEVEFSADLLKFSGAGIGMQVSAFYSQPELWGTCRDVNEKLATMNMEMVKVNLTISFNGSDPYTMFELPYHSNKEAVLGISAMVTRAEQIKSTSYMTDSLGIYNIQTSISRSLGLLLGWNWRLGESGWVFGLAGNLMFSVPENDLLKFVTSDQSQYSSAVMGFRARMITAGFGYHF